MQSINDKIVAISTPFGDGGIAIIRLSGEKVYQTAIKIFKTKKTCLDYQSAVSHYLYFGEIYDKEEKLDEGFMCLMKSPRSYTGEDIVEFHIHGGRFIAKRILNLLIDLGARLARPGEFTMRAFLNGRMDLTQAEGVIDIINSKTEEQRKLGIRQLSGGISKKIHQMRERLLELIVRMEANIDFPDYVPDDHNGKEIISRLDDIRSGIGLYIETTKRGMKWRDGFKIVLLGAVNVGKSSVLNSIVGESKAIVSKMPGTTRDAIEVKIDLKGLPLDIVDCAGYRKPRNKIELIGIRILEDQLSLSDLVLYVIDSSKRQISKRTEILALKNGKPCICVLNKSDLPARFHVEQIKEKFSNDDVIWTSALTGSGINELIDMIYEKLKNKTEQMNETLIVNERHLECFKRAENAIKRAIKAMSDEKGDDLASADIRQALSYLDEIVGISSSEELLETIFSRFCIGK